MAAPRTRSKVDIAKLTLLAATAAVVSAAGCSSSHRGSAGQSTTVPTAASTTVGLAVTVTDCLGDPPQTEPKTMTLACGDGGVEMQAIVWSSWGGASATGQGELSENGCNPNCAEGTFATEPASIGLSSLESSSTGESYRSVTTTPLPPNSKGFQPNDESLPG